MSGTPSAWAVSAQSRMAVSCGTPKPATSRVMQIDRDPTPFSATSITLKGSTLQLSVQLLQSVFEGTLGADGNTITGHDNPHAAPGTNRGGNDAHITIHRVLGGF